MRTQDIESLEKILGYTFKNKDLLIKALTHKTYAFEASTPIEYNERLEFLGDSILNFIISEQLYMSNKYFSEGELTRRRAISVNNKFLAERAIQLKIGDKLLLGKGEKKQNGSENKTNLANALEAIIGAIYLDSDMDHVKKFIMEKLYTTKFNF
ncbi:MAG: ribonuclease III domain-containing protein [Candidatus Thermoplasmatota archaeon]